MNPYVQLIGDAVSFMEDNLCAPLSLQAVARQFHISAFHFDRLFSAVAGQSFKQYLLGRKLSVALDALSDSQVKVIDIAYDMGFASPEVFSRAFKKQFGLSPEACRRERPTKPSVPRAIIAERDFAHYHGRVAPVGRVIRLDGFIIWGDTITVNPQNHNFRMGTEAAADALLHTATADCALDTQLFYNAVRCTGVEDGAYMLFMGFRAMAVPPDSRYQPFSIPEGNYVQFQYTGDLFDIQGTFTEDIIRWVMVHELLLRNGELGMLCVLTPAYPETHAVEVLVPVIRA